MWIYSSDYYFWNKLSTTCLAGLYVGLRKYCIFQCEANVEQIIAIVTTSSVSCFISEEQFSCNSTWFYILLKTNCSQKQPPEVFITLLKWDSNTANGPSWKLIDGSILTIFPHKEQKEEREKILKHRCFPVNFVEFLRTPFYKNTYGNCFWRWAWRNQTTAHDIRIEQILSLNDLLWIILAIRQNGHVVIFFYSRPKAKMRQN